MKWITKRALLTSNEMMQVAISKVLVGFVHKAKSEGKIGLWYTSLKNDDGLPSFRIYLQIKEGDEEAIQSEFYGFLRDNAKQIGWNGHFFDPDPVFDASYPHLSEINQACEIIIRLLRKFPQADRLTKRLFWNEAKTEFNARIMNMGSDHHADFIHFLANNLGIDDKSFLQMLLQCRLG